MDERTNQYQAQTSTKNQEVTVKKNKPNRSRDKSILLRVTEVEKDTIEANAKLADMSVNEFLLTRALNDKKIKVETKPHSEEILQQLRGIGSNLNQIAKYINVRNGIPAANVDRTLEFYNKALHEILELKKEWS